MFEFQKADPAVKSYLIEYGLYDYYRLVDVDTYEVYNLQDGILMPIHQCCFSYWNHEGACQNCISRSALSANRSFIKLETFEHRIFLVTALPIRIQQRYFALELIQEATRSLSVNDPEEHVNVAFIEMIQKMNDLAARDAYTGLYNKPFIEQTIDREIRRWTPERALIAAVLDIDRFKTINDTYGHVWGDQVILGLAGRLKECAAGLGGVAGRLGGDEFILVLSGPDAQMIFRRVEELRESLRQFSVPCESGSFQVSVSIGAAAYNTETGGWKNLLDAADRLMYQSKNCKRRIEPAEQ